MTFNVGVAFISVLPDLSGFQRAAKKDLDKIGPQIGVDIGQKIAAGIREGLSKTDPFEPLNRKQQEQQRKAPRDGDSQAGAFASAFQKRLKAAFASLPKAQIDADSTPADRKMQELRARLEALSGKTIGVDIDAGAALGQLAAIKSELEGLSRDASVNVRADVAAALAQIGTVEREVEKVGGQSPTVTVDADTAAADAELAVTDREVSRLDGRHAIISVSANVGSALAGLFSVRTALLSMGAAAAPAIVGIGAGIVGLAGPLAAAGAGFGGLAAVAIPAISHIKNAISEQNKAQQASTSSGSQAQQQALAMAGAQQALADAIRQAGYAHQQALDQVRSAEQQLTQAQVAAADAQRALDKARVEARQHLQDLANQVIDAGLAIQQDQLRVDEARLALEQYTAASEQAYKTKVQQAQAELDAANAAAKALQSQPDASAADVQAAQQRITSAQAALSLARQQQEAYDLQRKQAELAFKQAQQQLKEQTLSYQRLRQEQQKSARQGVEGSDQVRTAREALNRADQQVTSSELALARARENVARTDQQSAEQVASARRGVEQASLSAASATSQLGQATAKLTPLEAQAVTAVRSLSAAFKAWSTSLQPAVLPTLISGINLVKASLPLLTPIVQSASVAIGGLFRQASAAAQSPFWRQFSVFLGQTAGPAITQLGSIIGHLVTGLAGLAQAFAPIGMAFLTVLNQVAGRFSAFALGLAHSPGFQAFVTQMTNLTPLLVSTFSTLGSLLGSVLAALAPAVQPAVAFINTLGTALAGVIRAVGPAIQSVLATLGPALGQVVQALAPILTQLVQALAPLLVQLINGLKPILVGLAPIIGTVVSALQPLISGLLSALAPILQAILPVLGAFVSALGQILSAITPILAPLGQVITQLVQGLTPVLTPIIALLGKVGAQIAGVLVKTLVAALPAVNAVVQAIASLLPPMEPLIPLLGQLMTAFLPLLPPIIKLVAALTLALVPVLRLLIIVLVPVIQLILNLLIPVIRLLVNTLNFLVNATTAAVRAIAPLFTWLYTTIIKPVVDAIVIAIHLFATAMTWLWSNILSPTLNVIGIALKVVAAIVLFLFAAPIIGAIRLIAGIVTWLYNTIMKPYFTLIGALVTGVWNGIIKPAFNALVGFIVNTIAPAVRSFYNNTVKPIFTLVGSFIASIWNNQIRPAFDGLKTAIGLVGKAFGAGASAIKSAWDKVKQYTKDPINFVIGTVYNHGIVGLWNKVMGWLHLPDSFKLGEVPLLASGGTLDNPAPIRPFKTNGPMAIVGEGDSSWPEYVIPTDPKYRGRAQALWASAGGDLQMLAGGGILGDVVGTIKKIAGGVTNLVKEAFQLLTNPKQVFYDLMRPILSKADQIKTSPWGNAAAAVPGMVVDDAWTAMSSIVKAFNDGYGGDAAGVVAAAKKYIGIGDDQGPNNNRFSRAFGMPGLPWCFAAGTLVETPNGLQPIEEIEAGDQVITPSGEAARVATTLRRIKPVLLLSALGVCETAVTADHPYWTMQRLTPNKAQRVLGVPGWVRAGDLKRGDMIAKPIPPTGTAQVDRAFAELIGLYVAEGYCTHKDHGVIFCVHKDEAESVAVLVKEAGYSPSVVYNRTCAQVGVYDWRLYQFVQQAGSGAANKRVPSYVLNWDEAARSAFVAGYVRGDGHRPPRYPGRVVCQTVSRPLTVSLASLLLTLRISAGVRICERAGTQVIEGRTVQCREKYIIEWSEDQRTVDRPQFIWEHDKLWVPIRSVDATDRVERVYDITVPGEHAFIADGAHVSNCAMFVSTAIEDAHALKKYPGAPSAAVASFVSAMTHVGLDQGRPGDLAAYRGAGHINVIEAKSGGAYMTIGGNQNAVVQRGVRGGQSSILRPLARGGVLSGNDVWQIFHREAPNSADPHELSTPLVRLMRGLGPGTAAQVAAAITRNHLGVVDASFDSGGWLPPGVSTVFNGTGQPEPVLTGGQWESLRSAAAGGGGKTVNVMPHSTVVVSDPVDVDMLATRQEFLARSASF